MIITGWLRKINGIKHGLHPYHAHQDVLTVEDCLILGCEHPEHPWQHISADYIYFDGSEYLVVINYHLKNQLSAASRYFSAMLKRKYQS